MKTLKTRFVKIIKAFVNVNKKIVTLVLLVFDVLTKSIHQGHQLNGMIIMLVLDWVWFKI